jgi:hypothetical protein
MFNPFLETTEMTDDQLLDKINEVANKVSGARRANMAYNMIYQLEIMYHQLNSAYQERLTSKNTNTDTTVLNIGTIEGEESLPSEDS